MLRNVLLQRQVAQRSLLLSNSGSTGSTNNSSSSSTSKYGAQPCCGKSTSSTSLSRQGKIMNKLFGNRVTGSKKRWYPESGGGSNNQQAPSVVFNASQFGKSQGGAGGGGGKNATRRMTVLNKLFMSHITDLLATGEASENILGRGMQVSRVKISSDFACINVYWLGTNDVQADAALETELQRCSGVLRHELSQLRLMGEVPRIKFVRDRTGGNIQNVESILRGIDFEKIAVDERTADEEQKEQRPAAAVNFDIAQTVRQEFYGKTFVPKPMSKDAETPMTEVDVVTEFPEMRHDVLGLDHRDIMSKILTKMRKSKQAWELHTQLTAEGAVPVAAASAAEQRNTHKLEQSLENINLNKAATIQTSDKFDAFLQAKRRERKQTPERKKYRRENMEPEDWSTATTENDELEYLTPQIRQRYTEEDYIVEEHNSSSLYDKK